MSVDDRYLARVLGLLAAVAPVSCRRAFTGALIYHQQTVFAVVAGNRLYFRTDANSACLYQSRSMPVLESRLIQGGISAFHQLPDEVLENPAELRHWMRAAVEATREESEQPAEESEGAGLATQRQAG